MTTYVRRNGKLVDKATLHGAPPASTGFPTPRISRFEAFESPIDGKTISSWRERDRDMTENDCFDTRDLSPDHQWRRGREVQLKELEEVRANGERTDPEFEWRDTPGTGE